MVKRELTSYVKPFYGAQNDRLLFNPCRGFRLETYLDVSSGRMLPGHEMDAIQALDACLKRYAPESPRVVQAYFYLTEYRNRELDKTAFMHMQTYFDHCRALGIRLLLRFAYVYHESRWAQEDADSEERIQMHIRQLQPVVEQNRDVLFCLEAGFVGPWGEWSGGAPQNRRRILDYLLDHVPSDLFVMVRYVSVKNVLDADDPRRAIVGYHDDYLTGGPHTWNSGGMPETREYQQLDEESPYVPIDGEMPWAAEMADIDGMYMLRRLVRHHFTTLSIEHNYKEPEALGSLERWKGIAVTPALLEELGQPICLEWFQSPDGRSMARSLFEYLRDFLGYHIVVREARCTVQKDGLSVHLALENTGFSAPWGMRDIRLALVDEKGMACDTRSICEIGELQPGCTITADVRFPLPAAAAKVGVILRDFGNGFARLAVDGPFEKGANILFAVGEA